MENDSRTLSIVIPAWNEERTLETLVNKVIDVELPYGVKKEIVLVNDASKDKTWEIMQNLASMHSEIKAYSNAQNSGKTQTVKNGISYTSGDFVVIQDADLEYEPSDFAAMLKLMIDKNLDVVYGNRFGKKNGRGYVQNYLGNLFLSFASNVFTFPRIRSWIPDMEVCYKLIRGDVARELGSKIESRSKFGLEPEITARLARYKLNGKHLKFGIVPINYYPRTMAEGKKMNAVNDGIKAVKEILTYNLK